MNRFFNPTDSNQPFVQKVRTVRAANTLGVLVLMLALTAIGFEASARGFGHRDRPGPPGALRGVGALADKLGIDEETLAEIEAIEGEGRTEGHAIRLRLNVLNAELREVLEGEEPDEARVMLKAEKIGDLKTQARKNQLRTMIRVRALLTPEQRQKLVRIHAARKHHAGRKHDGPGGPRDRGRLDSDR